MKRTRNRTITRHALSGCRTLVALGALAASATAGQWLVDASGVDSDLRTIDQAMAVASPGDRIFVLPGDYPAFHFSRGVEVIGLGADASEVTVARVDFHVVIPTTGYDAVLSNLTVCGTDAADAISVSGNELGPGTLLIDAVRTCGGAFLHGAGEFYLLVSNSFVAPEAGHGFMGAGFDFAGGTFDLVDSHLEGWNADALAGIPAGVALRVGGSSVVRASGTRLFGGDGALQGGSPNAVADGAAAIAPGFGAGFVELRLSGDSQVVGGSGADEGVGGAGVHLSALIERGDAFVSGGRGAEPGLDWGLSQPIELPFDPYLALRPSRAFATRTWPLEPGEAVRLTVDESVGGPLMLSALALDPPTTPGGSPLANATPIARDRLGLICPPCIGDDIGSMPTLRRTVLQARFVHPLDGRTLTTNPLVITMRVQP